MSDFRLLINGRPVKGAGTLDVINPATGRTLTAAPRADRAQLDEARQAPERQEAALRRTDRGSSAWTVIRSIAHALG
jgi:acyl-CoA reductase-like NAD-dependent aldehyde dehydrogenase